MKIAVTGNTGYIGNSLIRELKKQYDPEAIITIGHSGEPDMYIDLSNADEFDYSSINGIDIIVFTAAVSGPNQCAEKFDESWNVNVTGTGRFIEEAIKRNCKVLFFSSDTVFGKDEGKAFSEDSPTAAETPYGVMKKAIEDRFCGEMLFKALRLSYVISRQDKFVLYYCKCMKTGEEPQIYHPFYRNCITLNRVVELVCRMINKWDELPFTFINIAGTELVSRVRIADELNRFYNTNMDYKVSDPGECFFKNRAVVTEMKSVFLREYGLLDLGGFSEELCKELRESE